MSPGLFGEPTLVNCRRQNNVTLHRFKYPDPNLDMLEPYGPFFLEFFLSLMPLSFLSGARPALPMGVAPDYMDDYELVMHRLYKLCSRTL
jgi:hypothetical protein